MQRSLIALLCLAAVLSFADAGKILMMPAAIHPSHKMVFLRLAEELIKRGHEVVLWQATLKPDKQTVPAGVKERIWTVKVPEKYIQNMFLYENSTVYNVIWETNVAEPSLKAANWAMMLRVCEVVLETRKADFDRMVAEYFDVIILDDLFNPCGLLYAGLTRRPFIYYSQTHMRTESAWANQSPSPPSYIPVPGTGYTDIMDFWERGFNLLSYIKTLYIHHRMILRPMDRLFQKHYPGLTEAFYIERNASLNYVNTPPIFDFPRPYMPRVVFVGGLHCHKARPLEGQLEQFIAEVPESEGFLLFTTGHTVQWQRTPKRVVNAFVQAFAELPQRVVWQYDGPPISGLPKNVIVMPWVPQQDLLGNPKCKGFITHGGINSVVESMWHGVPIIGIPIIEYHRDYIMRAVGRQAGLVLEKSELTKAQIVQTVQKLLKTSHHKVNVDIFMDLLRDVPYTELDHAAFWVEFVIRHQEVPQARSGADDLNIFQYFLIDVIAFLFACFVLWCIVSYYVLKVCCMGCCFACRKCRGVKPKELEKEKKGKKD